MKADLLEMVKGYPCHMEEMVAHTPDDHLFLNRIGDRYMAVAPVTSCCAGCFAYLNANHNQEIAGSLCMNPVFTSLPPCSTRPCCAADRVVEPGETWGRGTITLIGDAVCSLSAMCVYRKPAPVADLHFLFQAE